MARKDGKLQLLRNVGLFAACSDKDLAGIARIVTEMDIDPGQTLTTEGKPGGEFFVIRDGTARVMKGGRKRATLGAGDFFGELALLDQGPRSATVVAETEMSVFVLDAREFASLLDGYPSVARKVLKALARRLRDADGALTH